ncbi:hypothetical protein Aperf_G00000131770 [Anoplocephala perfoliata]
MSALDVTVRCSMLSSLQRTSLSIKFMHFFLYNTGQFPDFNLLTSKAPVSASAASSVVSIKKLQSCLDSLSLLERELKCLASNPIEQFLFILGPNIHKPSRMVMLDFQNCSIDQFASEEGDLAEDVNEEFSDFFRSLMENPSFAEIFASVSPTRLHVYFRTHECPTSGDFIPRMNFKLLSRNCAVHVLNVLPKDDTMDLSLEKPNFDGNAGLSKRLEELLQSDGDMRWYSCSKVVTGC